MADNEVRNRVVTEFSSDGLSEFGKTAVGAAAALGAVAMGQHLFNQAMSAAAAPLNSLIQLNVQRENQIRSMTSALVAQQAIGGTRAMQIVADQAAVGTRVVNNIAETVDFTSAQLAAGRAQYAQYGDAAEGAFRRSATSAGTFMQATQAAQQMMRMMVVDAAALPGEVNDYATAMQIASSSVIQAVAGTRHSTARGVMGMINNVTAAALNSQIDSAQAGRDIMRMMSPGRGQAEIMNRTWTEVIMPYARNRQGGQLSAQQFNAMTAARRFEVLQGVGQQMRNIMNMSSDSWDAVTGALTSARNELIQFATAPVYKIIQSTLARFSAWLNEGVERGASFLQGLQRVGEYISTLVSKWLDPIIDWGASLFRGLSPAADAVNNVTKKYNEIFSSAQQATGAIASFADSFARHPIVNMMLNVFQQVAEAVQGAITSPVGSLGSALRTVAFLFSYFNPYLFVAAGFLEFLARGTASAVSLIQGLVVFGGFLVASFAALRSAFDIMVETVSALWEMVGAPLGAILMLAGALIYGTIVGIVAAFELVATMLYPFIIVATGIIETFMFLIDAIVTFGGLLVEFVGIWFPAIQTGQSLSDALRTLREDALFVAHSIREAFNELREMLGISSVASTFSSVMPSTEENPTMRRLRELMNRMNAEDADQRLGAPRQRATSNTHNDFRFSRFDITQRFAEGFDPDRIATFFQRDIANAANQRTESGFAPAFST